LARFKREAQAAGRLNLPGIVGIYEYGEDIAKDISDEEATVMATSARQRAPRVAFIAMEFVKGRELRDLLEKGERFAMPEVARIMGEILDALDHAHSQRVVHRDMKPAGLIVLDNGHIKIADFGIEHLEKSELTQTGAVMGTPSYMSPEQFAGQPVDGRSDLFSCGVILYQLLTGEKPFTGESTTTIMYKVLREEPVPPSQLNVTLAPELDAVVKKALAKAPAQRFQSGEEFAQALRAATAGESQAQPAAAPAHLASPMQPASVIAAPIAVTSRSCGVGPWVAGFAVLVAVAAGAYMLLAPGRSPAPAVARSSSTPAVSGVVSSAPATAPGAAASALLAGPTAAPTAAAEPGTLIIGALGLADPGDKRFNGDLAAAQLEARDEAKRQLVEKALALYVEQRSLEGNHALLERKLLSNPGAFIRTVVQEGAPSTGKGGLVEMPTRAVVSLRDVQKSLNQLLREEHIDFIRNKGDPRISIRIDIASADGPAIGRERSQLAENVVKERIKSFGFRVWSSQADNLAAANAQPADFAIRGEVKVKQLSTKLQASGLTITKTALTSWIIKAIDLANGKEVYLSTRLPFGKSWGSEDQALTEIGKLVGDEFSRNFFLQHFSFRRQKAWLVFTGLPEGSGPSMLRELRGMRTVLDAQLIAEPGRFQLQLPEGSTPDIVQEAIVRPLNAKLGMDCFALGGTSASEVTIAYAASCATPQMRTKLDTEAPAGSHLIPAARAVTPKQAAAARNTA